MAHAVSLLLVVTAAVVAYLNAGGGALVFDAKVIVGENPAVQTWSAESVRYLFTHDYWQPMATDGLYRPLTTLSFLFDRGVLGHGDAAFGYVVENVALHAICAMLVYALVWQAARRRWAATVAALLFAVHPITTEAVTNVVGRADLLAAAGVLGGLLCWVRGRDPGTRRWLWRSGSPPRRRSRSSARRAARARRRRRAVGRRLPAAGGRRLRAEHAVVGGDSGRVPGGALVGRSDRRAARDIAPVDNPLVEAPFLAGRLTALGVLVREAGLLLWPATLSVDYSYRQIPVVGAGASAAWASSVSSAWRSPCGRSGAVRGAGRRSSSWAVRPRRHPAVLEPAAADRQHHGRALPLSAARRRGRGRGARRRRLGVDGKPPDAQRPSSSRVVSARAHGADGRRNLDWRDDRTLWAATVQAAPESAKANKAYANALAGSATDVPALSAAIARSRAGRRDPARLPAGPGRPRQLRAPARRPFAGQPDVAQRWYEKALTALESARAIDEKSTARFVEKMRARGNPTTRSPTSATPSSSTTSRSPT
jgi:hypothetical protein